MWKILARTSIIMERIPKLSFGLFIVLLIIIDSPLVQCATVDANDITVLLDGNNISLSCGYTLGNGERPLSMTISRKRTAETSYTILASFGIPYNESSYGGSIDDVFKQRTTLMLTGNSANIVLHTIDCRDEATYECSFSIFPVGTQSITKEFNLKLEAEPTPPIFTSSPNSQPYKEFDELEYTCKGDEIGIPAGNYLWFGYREGNSNVDLTSQSEPGTPQQKQGARFCVFERESKLKLNLTKADNGLTVRCVANHTTLGAPPLPNDQCDPKRCKQTQPIVVYYSIRNIQTSSNPAGPDYIVNSGVTLTCTAESNPAPVFRWQKDGDDSKFKDGSQWTLENLSLGDTGTYTCYAYNNVSGTRYNDTKSVNINVVETTTSTSTSTTSATTSENGGGKTDAIRPGPAEANTTTIIIVVVVVLGVLLIVAVVVAFVIIRRKRAKKGPEEPPEKPYNNHNMNMFNAKPDLVNDEKKQNYNYNKPDDRLTYADLKFDDKPRSRRPVALADNMTDYADIAMPHV